jgi:hypothetical protein
MVKFDKIIHASLEWTTAVLFRPFNLKKWLILAFIALLAGAISSANFNLNLPSSNNHRFSNRHETASSKKFSGTPQNLNTHTVNSKAEFKNFLRKFKTWPLNFIVLVAALFFLGFLIFFVWLHSRFCFIFIENIVTNDISIIEPFRRHKKIADSYFVFNLGLILFYLLITLLIIVSFFNMVFNSSPFHYTGKDFIKLLSILLPLIIVLIIFWFVAILIYVILVDFVQPIMFRDKTKFFAALNKVLILIKKTPANFACYILIKAGLAICASLVSTIVSFVAIFGLILPLVLIASAAYFIYKTLAGNFGQVFLVFCVIFAIPLFLALWYFLISLYLPFAVFFRTLSIKFMAEIDQNYNLFRCN